MTFNFRQGPFQDKRLRTAAAHAIDRQAIHNSVFYGQGAMLDQPYPRGNPWHLEGSRSLEYDLDKAKVLVKEARAVGTAIELTCNANLAYNRESAQVVQELWNSIGFKVTMKPLDTVPLPRRGRRAIFTPRLRATTTATTRMACLAVTCTPRATLPRVLSGWHNARYDRLVEEAKRTLDQGAAQGAVH